MVDMRKVKVARGKKSPTWRRILKWLVLATLALLVLSAAWLTFDIYRLRGRFPEKTSFMSLREDEAREKKRAFTLRYTPVPFSKISGELKNTVILAEDGAFYAHHGFDFFEIKEALRENQEKGKVKRGASTITQQLAKNLYLSPTRSYWRKALEALITLELEALLTKPRIYELYLNTIEWGPGIFGCEAAARAHYRTSCAALTQEQSVNLAAVIPNPLQTNPESDNAGTEIRRQAIRERLERQRASMADKARKDKE